MEISATFLRFPHMLYVMTVIKCEVVLRIMVDEFWVVLACIFCIGSEELNFVMEEACVWWLLSEFEIEKFSGNQL